MFEGLRTVVYFVEDLTKARDWYAQVLGKTPYYDTPYYVGFNVGGFELGLHPIEKTRSKGETVEAYWGVPNAEAAYAQLLEQGATEHGKVQDVGEGIILGSVMDPFGNILGVIQNPHFKPE